MCVKDKCVNAGCRNINNLREIILTGFIDKENSNCLKVIAVTKENSKCLKFCSEALNMEHIIE